MSWEQALIGTVLSDPAGMSEVVLAPSDFTLPVHQTIWGHMLTMSRQSALDYRALVEFMTARGELGDGDGKISETYLRELLGQAGTQPEAYARQVLNSSIKRQIRQVAGLVLLNVEDQDKSAEEILDDAETKLIALHQESLGDGKFHSMGDLISVLDNRVQQQIEGTYVPAWSTNVAALAEVIDFLETDDLLLIASRPGGGKSSFLRYDLAQGAMNGKPVLLINIENSHVEIARWVVSMFTGINAHKLKMGQRMNEAEYVLYRAAIERLAQIPFYVETMASPSVDQIDRVVRKNIHNHDISVVGVDYAQLVDNGLENKVADVTRTSQRLKAMAGRYHVPVMAAAQLSRAIETRGKNSSPMLSDLRESGSLEQDATHVMFIREFWDNPSPEILAQIPQNVDQRTGRPYDKVQAIPVVFDVRKNRNGPVDISKPVLWWKATNSFIPYGEVSI